MEDLDLTGLFKTKSQAVAFSNKLDRVMDKVYLNDFNLEKILMDEFGFEIKDKIFTLLNDNNISFEKANNIHSFLEKIKDRITTLPVVDITVAFEPKEHTLKLLSDWFMNNVGKQYLFNIKVDQELVAGASISFNGRHLEHSIKPEVYRIIEESLSPQPPKADLATPTPPPHINVEEMSLGR